MKLYYWRSSPHSCKVLAVLDILGLKGGVDLIPTHPWDPKSKLTDLNPLGKIPTLILQDGTALYDSSVICEYLASFQASSHSASQTVTAQTLFPENGEGRWKALKQNALAAGIMEAAVSRLLEEKARPFHLQSQTWIARQQNKIDHSFRSLEKDAPDMLVTDLTIGQVSLAIAVAYVTYRYPSYVWHLEYPQLTTWYEKMMRLPAIAQNSPKEVHPLPELLEKID